MAVGFMNGRETVAVVVVMLVAWGLEAQAAFGPGRWERDGHATYYGGPNGGGTMGGACGYGNLYATGYGLNTAALSGSLFKNGLTCGACYEITCIVGKSNGWCYANKKIVVTATNFCPQGSTGGWCNAPRKHFDLPEKMFLTLAKKAGGVVPINYRRVACAGKRGGQRFTIAGHNWFFLVLVHNVAGAGEVHKVFIKSAKTGWMAMRRNWGQMWEFRGGPNNMVGNALSFRVHTSDGRQVVSKNAAPANWKFGRTFSSNAN